MSSLAARLKSAAGQLGFVLAGICPAVAPPGIDRFRAWLDAGYAGEMAYLPRRAAAYEHPRHVLDGVRSLVMLALPYRTVEPEPIDAANGRVSRYAWGAVDYHDVVHDRLQSLAELVKKEAPQSMVRGVVDSAPLLEREFAQLAGLGWIGKNTLLLNKQWGSWFFLAALLTDLELDYDIPFDADHCGTCRACLDACPTQAFPRPYVLDATRCISYLTIELRGDIPEELREPLGEWVFGCDVCQEVCPWNHKPSPAGDLSFLPKAGSNPLSLDRLLRMSDAEFRELYRRTPLWRAKRRGLLRNAAIVAGNQRDERLLPALRVGLDDHEPLVRDACRWAIGRLEMG